MQRNLHDLHYPQSYHVQLKCKSCSFWQVCRTRGSCCSTDCMVGMAKNAASHYYAFHGRQQHYPCHVVQEPRQVAMIRNPAVRMKCDHQTDKAWLRGWEQRTNASTADFCDVGGAAELAVKAQFAHMRRWAWELSVGSFPSHPPHSNSTAEDSAS